MLGSLFWLVSPWVFGLRCESLSTFGLVLPSVLPSLLALVVR
jgi:hypothetical protein